MFSILTLTENDSFSHSGTLFFSRRTILSLTEGYSFAHGGTFFFSQNSQMNRTHKVQSKWWPLPRPLPRRKGEWSPRYPYGENVGFVMSLISNDNSWKVLWTLYAGGLLWDRNSAQKGFVKSVSSVRENISFVKERSPKDLCKQPNRGNLSNLTLPCGERNLPLQTSLRMEREIITEISSLFQFTCLVSLYREGNDRLIIINW